MQTIEPLVDNRGTTLLVGQVVAYNHSGEIAMGEIIAATPAIKDGWQYVKRALIKVKTIFPMSNRGGISKVRCPKNVMVIKE